MGVFEFGYGPADSGLQRLTALLGMYVQNRTWRSPRAPTEEPLERCLAPCNVAVDLDHAGFDECRDGRLKHVAQGFDRPSIVFPMGLTPHIGQSLAPDCLHACSAPIPLQGTFSQVRAYKLVESNSGAAKMRAESEFGHTVRLGPFVWTTSFHTLAVVANALIGWLCHGPGLKQMEVTDRALQRISERSAHLQPARRQTLD